MLSEKVLRFCEEYLVDLSPAAAAARTGYSKQYGCTLLKKPDVQAHLEQSKAERLMRVRERQDSAIDLLKRIAFADINDFITFDPTPQLKSGACLDGAVISELSISKEGTVKLKLHDKMKALELLGKHEGLYRQKQAEEPAKAEETLSLSEIHEAVISAAKALGELG